MYIIIIIRLLSLRPSQPRWLHQSDSKQELQNRQQLSFVSVSDRGGHCAEEKDGTAEKICHLFSRGGGRNSQEDARRMTHAGWTLGFCMCACMHACICVCVCE